MNKILSYNNQNDIPKMKCYHRTKDIINLLTFFPQCSPIKNLIIFENVLDYMINYDKSKEKSGHRVDTLINKPVINGIETGSDKQDFVEIIKRIKKICDV